MPLRRLAGLLSVLYLASACASAAAPSVSSFSPTTGPVQALGVRDALNLDGGATSAMWLGSYRVAPGRLLPNAVLLIKSSTPFDGFAQPS